MNPQPKTNQPAYLLAGVLFSVIALVALIALFMLKSKADVTTQEVYPGASAPTVSWIYASDVSGSGDIGPAGIGTGFTTNEGLPKNIYVRGELVDLNGCHNLMQATVTLYRSGLIDSQSCAADTNNCYHTTLYPADFVGCDTPEETTVTFETSFSLPNYVDPSDAGSPYDAENWVAYVNVADNSELSNVLTETYEVNSLAAFSVPNAINYGTVALGGDSSAIQLTFSNTGNRDVDSDVYAVDDMVSNQSGFDNIAASAVHYSLTSGFTYGTGDTAVAKAPSTDLALALDQQTDDLTIPTTDTYWRLRMPASGVQGTYTNTVVFTAKAAEGPAPLSVIGSIDLSSQGGVSVSYTAGTPFDPYAYVMQVSGSMKVLNETDPSNPTVEATLNSTLSNAVSMTKSGDYVYVANQDASNNFQIIDVTVPSSPSIAYTGTTIVGGVQKLVVYDNYVYLIGGTTFSVVDVTNKTSPSYLSGSLTLSHTAVDLTNLNDTAYVVTNNTLSGYGTLYAIDVTTPSAPSIINPAGFQTNADAKMVAAFTNDRPTLYVVGDNTSSANVVDVVDVYNPASMSLSGTYTINANTVNSVAINQTYLYVADKGEGLDTMNINTVDVTVPASMSVEASTHIGPIGAGDTINHFAVAGYSVVFLADQNDGIFYSLLSAATPGIPVGGGGGPVGFNGSVGKFASK